MLTPERFDFFNLPLLKGDKQLVLMAPNPVVLSQQLATKIFNGEDPFGKLIELEIASDVTLQVTGIVQKIENSYLQYDAYMSWNTAVDNGGNFSEWYKYSVYNYLKLIRK